LAAAAVKVAADEWMRTRGPYKIGHREGVAEGVAEGVERGIERGIERGMLAGRREALAMVLELRGLTPSADEQARIDACADLATLARWCERAKTATDTATLFD